MRSPRIITFIENLGIGTGHPGTAMEILQDEIFSWCGEKEGSGWESSVTSENS